MLHCFFFIFQINSCDEKATLISDHFKKNHGHATNTIIVIIL